jgi:hypothetical protein
LIANVIACWNLCQADGNVAEKQRC